MQFITAVKQLVGSIAISVFIEVSAVAEFKFMTNRSPSTRGALFLAVYAALLVHTNAEAELLFFDTFEYPVERTTTASDPSGVNNEFIRQGGWSRVKAVNITGSHLGYLYTASEIPGYMGTMPGINSSRVLALEVPNPREGGSDFYLQYGDGESSANNNRVPANVWFQFWHYTNHSGSQLTRVENRHKWIYPCNGPYPCSTNKWLLSLSSTTYNPLNQTPYENPTNRGEAFLISRDHSVGDINYSVAGSWDASKLGQFRSDEYLAPNRWSLVKIHFDTSDASSGKFEAWIRPMGGQFVKVAEWIGGVTPNFTWTLPQAGGHRTFKIPTTIGWTDGAGPAWYYIDDFAMATTEASLPVYGDTPPLSPPSPPTNLTVE